MWFLVVVTNLPIGGGKSCQPPRQTSLTAKKCPSLEAAQSVAAIATTKFENLKTHGGRRSRNRCFTSENWWRRHLAEKKFGSKNTVWYCEKQFCTPKKIRFFRNFRNQVPSYRVSFYISNTFAIDI